MKSLIVLAVCMLPSLFANAQTVNKGLDPSFGNKGIQYTEPYAGGNMKHAYQLALTNDGKIMVAGSYLMRLKADGTPDSSFADYGFYEPPTFYSATQPFPRPGKTSSFLLMPDGKIIATIYAWADLNGVMRLFPDGKVDSGFGDKGYLKIDYGTAQYSLIQSDGKILVAGDQNNAPYSYVIHRFNADWSVDSAFGTHGIAKMESGIYQGEVAGLGIMANGRIIIGGTGYDTSSRRAEVIQRYLPSGQPDSTFGGTGEIYPLYADYCYHAYFYPDGKSLLALGSLSGYSNVGRLKADGTRDSSFGINGFMVVDSMQVTRLLPLPDGRILCGGAIGGDYAIARLKKDGKSVDSSFGINGKIRTDVTGYNEDEVTALAVQADGKIIAAGDGRKNNMTSVRVILTRYKANAAVGIAKPKGPIESKISVYPNPATGVIHIRGLSPSARYQAALYSADGRLVGCPIIERNAVSIEGLPAGRYILNLSDDAGFISNHSFIIFP